MAALRSALGTRTTDGFARLVGLGGALLTMVGLDLTLLFWVLVPAGDTVLLSLSWNPVAAPVLLLAFVGSFVVGFGWYFVLLPSPLAMIGVGGLLYGVSAVLMVVAGTTRGSRGGMVRQ